MSEINGHEESKPFLENSNDEESHANVKPVIVSASCGNDAGMQDVSAVPVVKYKRSNFAGVKPTRFEVHKVTSFALDSKFESVDDDESNRAATSPLSRSFSQDTAGGDSYATNNVASLRQSTRERPPRVAYYRDCRTMHTHAVRPTLDELHNLNLGSSTPKVIKCQGFW